MFEGLGQPTINGYLIAGAMVGPGGLQLVEVSSGDSVETEWDQKVGPRGD